MAPSWVSSTTGMLRCHKLWLFVGVLNVATFSFSLAEAQCEKPICYVVKQLDPRNRRIFKIDCSESQKYEPEKVIQYSCASDVSIFDLTHEIDPEPETESKFEKQTTGKPLQGSTLDRETGSKFEKQTTGEHIPYFTANPVSATLETESNFETQPSSESLTNSRLDSVSASLGCGGDLTGNSGSFNSINYPQPYDHFRTCEWTITVELGHSITLSILDIDLERSHGCEFDSLEVYIVQDDTEFLLVLLCNQQNQPQQVFTNRNQMFVRFTTDESVNGGGFNATYVSNLGDCGGNFSTPTGNIYSLNYPNSYPNNSTCSWLITVEENTLVKLKFNSFNLENSSDCMFDYVKVYDGGSTASPLLLTWCGDSLPSPPVISATNNTIFVRMHSDHSVAASGFHASYATACGGRRDATLGGYINSPNFPTSYFQKGYNCSWIIQSPNPTDRVTLTFVALDLETTANGCSDFVHVLDGDDFNALGADPICGTTLPDPITSFGSSMIVDFIVLFSKHDPEFRAIYSTAGAACGGDFTAPSGTFTNPGYPDSYPQSVECTWNISVSIGSRIQISFSMFSIEDSSNCTNDFLEVREVDESGAFIGHFCGSTPPSNLTVDTSAWLRFQSNSSGTAPGFVITYQQVNGFDLSGRTGQITSPGYPALYDDGLSVIWTITVDPSYFILITFLDVEIEGAPLSCPYDYVRIYDGITNQAAVLAEICGTTIPNTTITTGNTAFVQFITDGSSRYKGFSLKWQQT